LDTSSYFNLYCEARMKFKFLNLPNILDIDHRPEQVINHAYYNTLSSKTFTPK